MGHQTTGTVRKERIDKTPLESDVTLKKKRKRHIRLSNWWQRQYVCRWNDNSVVTAASSGAGIDPLCLANRCSQKQKQKLPLCDDYQFAVFKKTSPRRTRGVESSTAPWQLQLQNLTLPMIPLPWQLYAPPSYTSRSKNVRFGWRTLYVRHKFSKTGHNEMECKGQKYP